MQLEVELEREWNSAEAAIKAAEILSHMVVIPAIVELRYAGRRAVEALAAEGSEARAPLFADAILSCRRAQAEALDAQAFYLMSNVPKLRMRPRLGAQTDDQIQLHMLLNDIGKALVASRQNKDLRTRIYDEIGGKLRDATALYLSLRSVEVSDRLLERSHRWVRYLTGAVTGLAVALPFAVYGREIEHALVQLLGF